MSGATHARTNCLPAVASSTGSAQTPADTRLHPLQRHSVRIAHGLQLKQFRPAAPRATGGAARAEESSFAATHGRGRSVLAALYGRPTGLVSLHMDDDSLRRRADSLQRRKDSLDARVDSMRSMIRRKDSLDARMDSMRAALRQAAEDSLGVDDSLGTDSAYVWQTKGDIDTTVVYSSKDSVVYKLSQKNMHMYGDAKIDYGSTGITAERITIDWEGGTIAARGVEDTTAGQEGQLIGTPAFREGSEQYEGEEMSYNFRTKKGVVSKGETALSEGFYLGERIKRVSDKEYYICDGRFTSCDNLDHKHYYFGASEMKMMPDDVIIARPATFYIEDIPLLWLPFAVIPASGGRSSGIIMPVFGDDASRGYNLRNGGYYLAMSDYWDLALTGDWYSKGGWVLNSRVRYALRYNFEGSVDARYGKQRFNVGNVNAPDDPYRTDYKIVWTHNQTLTPTSRVNVNFSFLTDDFNRNFSNDLNSLLNQTVSSRATYSKNWEGTSRSLSVNVTREQNLANGTWQMTLPDISFNQSQIFPFKREKAGLDQKWYEMIGFNYNGRALNTFDLKQYEDVQMVGDTLITNTVNELFDRRGLDHNISLIATPKLGYFTVSPSLSFRERWYDSRIERGRDEDGSVVGTPVRGFYALHTFRAGVSANTKIYGMFTPGMLGVTGIRHTMQPTVSYNYTPDFADSKWGYYQSYTDSLGQQQEYDPYSSYGREPGQVFGGVSRGESQSLGFSLNNIVEMKLDPTAEDTTGEGRKFQLFTLGLGSSYNFAADSMRLAPVTMNLRTSIQNFLQISGSASFTPYVWQYPTWGVGSNGRPVLVAPGGLRDEYLWENGNGVLRMTNFNLNLSTTVSQDFFKIAGRADVDTSTAATLEEEDEERPLLRAVELDKPYSHSIPWSVTLNYLYGMQQLNPERKTRTSNLRANLNISPTPNWHLTASAYYDLARNRLDAPEFTVRRDLHCWEMNFRWRPFGEYRSFDFVISLKSSMLKDVKLEKHGNDRGVY